MYLRFINISMIIPIVTKTPASKFHEFKDTTESFKMNLITLFMDMWSYNTSEKASENNTFFQDTVGAYI